MFKRWNPNGLFLKNSYIPSTTLEWSKLDQDIRNAESYALFRKQLLNFIRSETNSIFNIHNAKGIKLLTRLRGTQISTELLRCNKNPSCGCENFVELITHFLLHCTQFLIKDWLPQTRSKTYFWEKRLPHNRKSSFRRRETFHNR